MLAFIGVTILIGTAWYLSGKETKENLVSADTIDNNTILLSEEELCESYQEVYRTLFSKEPPIYLSSSELKFRIKTKINKAQ